MLFLLLNVLGCSVEPVTELQTPTETASPSNDPPTPAPFVPEPCPNAGQPAPPTEPVPQPTPEPHPDGGIRVNCDEPGAAGPAPDALMDEDCLELCCCYAMGCPSGGLIDTFEQDEATVPVDAQLTLRIRPPTRSWNVDASSSTRIDVIGVPGSATVDDACRVITFTPDDPLAPGTSYEVQVVASAWLYGWDMCQDGCDDEATFTFHTE